MDLVEVELLIALDRLVNYCDRFSEIDTFCKDTKPRSFFVYQSRNVESCSRHFLSSLRFELKALSRS